MKHKLHDWDNLDDDLSRWMSTSLEKDLREIILFLPECRVQGRAQHPFKMSDVRIHIWYHASTTSQVLLNSTCLNTCGWRSSQQHSSWSSAAAGSPLCWTLHPCSEDNTWKRRRWSSIIFSFLIIQPEGMSMVPTGATEVANILAQHRASHNAPVSGLQVVRAGG